MIKKKYYWKELTSDGLLKEPKEFGLHYDTESLNDWVGHHSEETAIERLIEITKRYEYGIPSSLTLIIEYSVGDDI